MECNGICDREQCELEDGSCSYMVDMVKPPLALHGSCNGKCTNTIKMIQNEKGMNFTTWSCDGECDYVKGWTARLEKKKNVCNYIMSEQNDDPSCLL